MDEELHSAGSAARPRGPPQPREVPILPEDVPGAAFCPAVTGFQEGAGVQVSVMASGEHCVCTAVSLSRVFLDACSGSGQ